MDTSRPPATLPENHPCPPPNSLGSKWPGIMAPHSVQSCILCVYFFPCVCICVWYGVPYAYVWRRCTFHECTCVRRRTEYSAYVPFSPPIVVHVTLQNYLPTLETRHLSTGPPRNTPPTTLKTASPLSPSTPVPSPFFIVSANSPLLISLCLSTAMPLEFKRC